MERSTSCPQEIDHLISVGGKKNRLSGAGVREGKMGAVLAKNGQSHLK